MTYILGSRCKDGVVLIGDRKVTLQSGTDFEYSEKIFVDVHPIVVGSSGVLALFEKFREKIRIYVATANQTQQVISIDKFIEEIENYTRDLNLKYRERLYNQFFDVLIGIKIPGNGALLRYVNLSGIAEPIRHYKAIGHGEPYASIILKRLWNSDMTMNQVAELGYFAIKYIETFELDNSVGVGKEKPQIWLLPDGNPSANDSEEQRKKYDVRQADQNFLDECEKKAEKSLQEFRKAIDGIPVANKIEPIVQQTGAQQKVEPTK